MYTCYLNGKFYGRGDLEYMKELFVDYVVSSEMYGKDESDWKIVKEDINSKPMEEIRQDWFDMLERMKSQNKM